MNMLKDQYGELVDLAELYLLQEYTRKDRISCSLDDFNFFKKFINIKKTTPSASSQHSPNPKQPTSPASPPPPTPKSTESIASKNEPKTSLPNTQHPSLSSPPDPSPATKNKLNTPTPQVMPNKTPLTLDPLAAPKVPDFSEMKQLVKTLAPGLKIYEETQIPLISPTVKILVLFLPSTSSSKELLENMAKAISTHIAPTQLIDANSFETANAWSRLLQIPTLKLIIIPEMHCQQLPGLYALMKKENSQNFFQAIPGLLIPSPEALSQDPQLKQALWNTIKSFHKLGL